MGLSFGIQKVEDTDVRFSYSGFHDFRHRIARSIGLKDVYGGTETDIYETGRVNEIESSHPVFPLLDHSDSDGDMGPDDCGIVGAYLKVLIPEWEKELEDGFDLDLESDIEMGKRLAEVMMQCYEKGETLLFL